MADEILMVVCENLSTVREFSKWRKHGLASLLNSVLAFSSSLSTRCI